ncbi:Na+/H+ antiporter NhaC [Pseudohalioglobus sediminis]|uniref:Na+/H+ antiporter NhaC n=1 Tax=Pseudohalioglobus sediminis TaxID=2606449 RepID=A0A5B0WTK7_9GAMM|nr:Na+/H+ antiporter NhaC [Pseudohalioglobus sediminis]KAA1189767.1 Na+/H+ antiporter NhaC [Pseudohalioglobus sediminis]
MSHPKQSITGLQALAPILFLVVLLACSVYLFGADSSYGANQIALILATCVAALVGRRCGVSWREAQEGIVHGISLGLGPVLILLAVGMLIGTWILCGTVPTMIYYGVKILDPSLFYAASAAICAIVAVSIGSSWTVAGTLGIGLMGIAGSFGLSPAITAGAIISGAYFGDKLSPMSDTTNLASAVTGVDLFAHIRHMLWTTVPSFTLALLLFAVLGSSEGATPEEITSLQTALSDQFNIGLHLLLPLLLMLTLVFLRLPAFPAIVVSALAGAVFALLFQPQQVAVLAGETGDLSAPFVQLKGVWTALFAGFSADSGNIFLDELLSKGGMESMLNTVWLIISALGFGGVLERTGILGYLLQVALRSVNSVGSLVTTTVVTCIGTNALAADQFIAIAIPGRMYRQAYRERGLSALNLSRTLEDSATLTSALIPWNTCGAYMSATLGIATLSYAPYAFFNLLCPLVAIVYGYFHIALKPASHDAEGVAGVDA